jgi:hypothetical protein
MCVTHSSASPGAASDSVEARRRVTQRLVGEGRDIDALGRSRFRGGAGSCVSVHEWCGTDPVQDDGHQDGDGDDPADDGGVRGYFRGQREFDTAEPRA